MQTRQLDNWIDAWMQYTSNLKSPDLYHKWIAVSCLASALERKVSLQWLWHGRIYANFFIVLVGPPGRCKKGTAMFPAQQILRSISANTAADTTTEQALIRALRRTTDMLPRLDQTTGKQLIYNYAALTIFSEEMTVFFKSHTQDMVSLLCDWYDCKEHWEYETLSRGIEEMENIWVNLIAATTPDNLQNAKAEDIISKGLASRIIFVYEENPRDIPEGAMFKYDPVRQQFDLSYHDPLYENLRNDLNVIKATLHGQFKFSEAFYTAWRNIYDADTTLRFEDKRMVTYRERRATHHLKLAMVLNVARTSSMLLEEQDFLSAEEMLKWTERKMHMTFSGMGQSDLATLTTDIMRTISVSGKIMEWEIVKVHYYDGTKEDIAKVLATLTYMKFCTRDRTSQKEVFYIYNPSYEKGK